jgi:hypothetical protein
MKDLVERLAREAGLVQEDNADRAWTTDMCDGVLPATLERFAQLLVMEAVKVCEAQTRTGKNQSCPGATNGWWPDQVLYRCEIAIREHFGIEGE